MSKAKLRQIDVVKELVKNPEDIFIEMSLDKCAILHPVLGITGEVFEVLKAVRESDRDNLIEEAGDLMFYLIDFRIRIDALDRVNTMSCHNDDLEDVLVYIEEAAERLLDSTKKYVVYNKDFLIESAFSDLCIIESSLLRLLKIEAISEDYVRKHNTDKLKDGDSARYPTGYSDQAAQDRADKAN